MVPPAVLYLSGVRVFGVFRPLLEHFCSVFGRVSGVSGFPFHVWQDFQSNYMLFIIFFITKLIRCDFSQFQQFFIQSELSLNISRPSSRYDFCHTGLLDTTCTGHIHERGSSSFRSLRYETLLQTVRHLTMSPERKSWKFSQHWFWHQAMQLALFRTLLKP